MKTRKHFLTVLCLVALYLNVAFAEKTAPKKEKKDATLEMSYQRNNDLSRSLICKLYLSGMFENTPLVSATLDFYNGANKIGSLKTNKKGLAILVISPDYKATCEADGTYNFSVSYAGNDSLNALETKASAKDVVLEMKLDPKDTTREITASVFQAEGDKQNMLKGIDVKFYVPRMFSLLPVGEGTTDSTGTVKINFPMNIVGDSTGNLTIIARIVKHDVYATVEKSQVVAWGIPRSAKLIPKHRELWTEIAPVWMIVTLTILLLGVWLHYMFVIFRLTKLKKLKPSV